MRKKRVLLTGGSRGIGKSIAQRLTNNYTVVVPARKELNLLDNDSIDKFIEKYSSKPFDVIINNAGINNPEWIEEMTDQNIQETIQINLIAPIKLVRGFVFNMKKNKWGRIINISSIFGVIARGKQSMYSASKHAINGVTKALALELAQNNILVNSVCPGFTRTDLVVQKNSPGKIALLEKDIPLQRLAEPDEIASLVAFLISDENSYMTGSVIMIDGGYSIK